MQPTYIEIAQVFSQDQRYTVPLFQRPYVWSREDQWEPLWDDILGVLRRLQLRDGDSIVANHFLGTIVLEQKPTPTGSLPRREVIDGQQRLTTLQILLKAVVRHYMRLIVLDLDQGDEPQAIFETLNAHGTPLLPTDLIKNWLLWEAARQKLEPAPLYESFWRLFDRDHGYWRARVGTGHAARARVDTFLQNWLSKETSEAVSAKHLYDRFLRYAEGKGGADTSQLGVPGLMASIHADALRFLKIDKPIGGRRFDLFLERLKRLDVIVFHPLLLEVMARTEADPSEADEFGGILESYLVRRLVCGAQTRSYGSLAITILKAIRLQGHRRTCDVLREVLAALTGTDEWPSDEAFYRNWTSRPFYGYFKRDRVLMILQALEHRYQSRNGKAEPLMSFDWSQLQIEHVMPQAWESHWPLPGGVSPEERKVNLQRIGNLTLVSGKLNSGLSNGPWLDLSEKQRGKRSGLHKHTMLMINRNLLDEFQEWGDVAISARADRLFADAKEIWPR